MRTSVTILFSLLSACAPESPSFDTGEANDTSGADDTGTVAVSKAASAGKLPQGLTCGLIYYLGTGAAVENLYCLTYQTKSYSSAGGYTRVSTGDYGRSSGQGFYHMDKNSNSTGLYDSDSASVYIPAGAVCGLGHTANAPSETCMGVSTKSGCPSGWTYRTATDDSSGGHYWYWCEYQDPSKKCSTSSCYDSSYIPKGTVCGLGDNGGTPGQCLGKPVTSSASCPSSSWTYYGNYDYGAKAGVGLAWCAKNK